MTILVVTAALLAGLLIGLSMGALGGGGAILAIPVLIYLLDQSAAEATTGSLVVVGVTAIVGAVAASREGNVRWGQGLAFGGFSIAGAAAGARASSGVSEPVLLTAFAALVLVVAGVMAVRHLGPGDSDEPGVRQRPRPRFDDPIITFSPTFACQCPRALKLLVTATVVGLLTGFLGVGGGFLVVPALVLTFGLPMAYAAGTSLVAITVTSSAALAVRAGSGVQPDWVAVALLTVAAVIGGVLGARAASRVDERVLGIAFTTLLTLVGIFTATQALPDLLS